ncbi:MAG: sigma-70 family RNA polymerase sigma factor [Acidobacteria bacterium]|nr:sigma-70 family RNA polymerase sigma factor [Acidobacteriota bacterium]
MNLSDPNIYSEVYEQHHRGVYAAAYRILGNQAQAQDVVQDVFMKVWRKPEAFDSRRGELGSYLRLMGRSRALDLWREGQASGRAGDRLKVQVAVEGEKGPEGPERVVEQRSTRRDLTNALKTLPEQQREAVVLAYWGGLTAQEVAQRVNVPLGTAKSRIRLGLGKLRDEFEESPLAAAA